MRKHMGRHTGFSYVGLLILIAIVGAMAAGALSAGATMERRAAEEELLFIGKQFKDAFRSYYLASPTSSSPYPAQLSDLLLDPRFPSPRRHLRRIYTDPMTGKAEWGLVGAPTGGVMGVHSLSEEPPIKTTGFDEELARLDGKGKYSEWVFEYLP